MLNILLLTLCLVVDSFAMSISYGIKKIVIPFFSIIVISFISITLFILSITFSSSIGSFINGHIYGVISSILLILLGIYSLFQDFLKRLLLKLQHNTNKSINFKVGKLMFILQIYLEDTSADMDNSSEISLPEAIYLSLALSLDSLAIGLGAASIVNNYLLLYFIGFLLGCVAIKLGEIIGTHFSRAIKYDFSFISGIILICLGVSSLFR